MASAAATAYGTTAFHERRYDANYDQLTTQLLLEVNEGNLIVSASRNTPTLNATKAQKFIKDARAFGRIPEAQLHITKTDKNGETVIDLDATFVNFFYVSLHELNLWGATRGDIFSIDSTDVEWIEAWKNSKGNLDVEINSPEIVSLKNATSTNSQLDDSKQTQEPRLQADLISKNTSHISAEGNRELNAEIKNIELRISSPNDPISVRDGINELASLFDGVGSEALNKMFPPDNKKNWKYFMERGARNGLKEAAYVKRGKVNPFLAAQWWLQEQNPPNWDWARCLRVLAKNLPPRSADQSYLLVGDYEK